MPALPLPAGSHLPQTVKYWGALTATTGIKWGESNVKRSQLVGLSSLLLLIVPCYLFSLPFLGFTGLIAAGSGAVLGCLVALVSRRWRLGVFST